MSILANLLKKGGGQQTVGNIPPGLAKSVAAGKKTTDKRQLVILGLLCLAATGLAVSFIKPKTKVKARTAAVSLKPAPAQQPSPASSPAPPAAPATASSAAIVPAPSQPQVAAQPKLQTASQQQASGEPAPAVPRPAVKKAATAVKRRSVSSAAVPQGNIRSASAAKHAESADARSGEPRHDEPPGDSSGERTDVPSRLFAARSAESRGDYAAALQLYYTVLDKDADNYRVMNNIASNCLQLGRHSDALAAAKRALALQPDYVSAMVNGGIALEYQGNGNEARQLFSRAAALEPGNRQALYNLGLSQEKGSLPNEALASYQRLADSGDARGFAGMARVSEQKGNLTEAKRYYRAIVTQGGASQSQKNAARERLRQLE